MNRLVNFNCKRHQVLTIQPTDYHEHSIKSWPPHRCSRRARAWSLEAEGEAAATGSGGSCSRWGGWQRISAAVSSSSLPPLPSPSAPSAPSPTPTRGSSRSRAVPARGRAATRAGSAGAAPPSSGLRCTTRCSSIRASALPAMGLGCSAA